MEVTPPSFYVSKLVEVFILFLKANINIQSNV